MAAVEEAAEEKRRVLLESGDSDSDSDSNTFVFNGKQQQQQRRSMLMPTLSPHSQPSLCIL